MSFFSIKKILDPESLIQRLYDCWKQRKFAVVTKIPCKIFLFYIHLLSIGVCLWMRVIYFPHPPTLPRDTEKWWKKCLHIIPDAFFACFLFLFKHLSALNIEIFTACFSCWGKFFLMKILSHPHLCDIRRAKMS